MGWGNAWSSKHSLLLIISLLILWGVDLGVLLTFFLIFGSEALKTFTIVLGILSSIILIRLFFLKASLSYFNIDFADLWKGGLPPKILFFGLVGIFFLTLGEILVEGGYNPQLLEEFKSFVKISGNTVGALIIIGLQYIYYLLEILTVNFIYLSAKSLYNQKIAVGYVAIVWGFLHILNFFKVGFINAMLLATYVVLLSLVLYISAWKGKSMKIPIILWLIQVII